MKWTDELLKDLEEETTWCIEKLRDMDNSGTLTHCENEALTKFANDALYQAGNILEDALELLWDLKYYPEEDWGAEYVGNRVSDTHLWCFNVARMLKELGEEAASQDVFVASKAMGDCDEAIARAMR